MGLFLVQVQAVGNHGCDRERGDGETVVGCERLGCTDCIAREFVRRLKRSGADVRIATIAHWPETPIEQATVGAAGKPVDDLVTAVRSGSF